MPGRCDTLRCCFPGRRFPAYSVTGDGCSLNCAHCEGRLLRGMKAVTDADVLMAEAERLAGLGGTGFLLSGGCDEAGKVPLGPFVGAVRGIRKRWGLSVNVHTGLLDETEAESLASSQADAFSVDLHQSPSVIEKVLRLRQEPSAYSRTLEALGSAVKGSIVPHVTVGLDDGTDAIRSMDLASMHPVDGLVVLVFTPLPGTAMESFDPPSDKVVLGAIEHAMEKLDCPVSLGCVRPRGNSVLEIAAVEAGIRSIAMPSRTTIDWAEAHGIAIERIERCCAVHL